ncbi:MAG: glucose-1-phosphate cytidylyltransferase [Rickettsiales bacterium]|nr:glucose-1-phosphate cytidylyltransferase [Pseudomonadota bacterium]MDA0966762.1 glucose-1-phosphate cytidylyltransferase [Pseudomonadota bacterium]MDG4543434.1 glucose-1-phosphate cytidylyltransferase [Rickettsiales bacterium]MDG4546172.1 glucose-1-phosphate cytidylyltransferase [Rickettsiales bacterium]MDG4547645.1 glucose-1-phosphate cytidylyltransferase [Rickettsiales bacterium]
MKAVILAGGFGTRIGKETEFIPKPMIEIGGMPILIHIMKTYSHYGINDFVICLGYKANIIKDYFLNFYEYESDFTIDLSDNSIKLHNNRSQPWKITLVETGYETMTGGRLLAVKDYIKDEETFCFTYGDGVSDVNIQKLVEFHKLHGKLATLTSIEAPSRFGEIETDSDGMVTNFLEKPSSDGRNINGGYFVLSNKVLDYIKDGSSTIWEKSPLENLAKDKELMTYKHKGFWHCMDTPRDKAHLEELWHSGNAPWKV